MPSFGNSQRLMLGLAYAATEVNATVFRVSAVASSVPAGAYQYAAYYDPDGGVTIAQRRLDGGSLSQAWDHLWNRVWNQVTLPARGNVRDAHNGTVIGVSGDGIVHVAYDHHGDPLHYRRTARPHDISSFGGAVPMTGRTERRVTYPQFVSAPDGTLYFFYRDGASGNGNLCLNRYDAVLGRWTPLHHPLIDGERRCSPYWWRPSVGTDGSLHLAWCWRDSPDASSNHDICYMRSSDRGATWKTVTGGAQPLPVIQRNAPIAESVPMGSNLMNQCSSAADAQGHPHLAHYHNDRSGIPQYMHLWHDGTRWVRNIVSRRTSRFSLEGGGTLRVPISRPEIAVTNSGRVYLITREGDSGGNVRLYCSQGRDYERWDTFDLTPADEDLGEWEPTYDTIRLRETGILSLFVLPVQQGNHETATTMPPQTAYILEAKLD